MKSSSLIKMIEKDGWFSVRKKGSHFHFKHPEKKGVVTIPHPKKDIPKGTVYSILRQAESSDVCSNLKTMAWKRM